MKEKKELPKTNDKQLFEYNKEGHYRTCWKFTKWVQNKYPKIFKEFAKEFLTDVFSNKGSTSLTKKLMEI